TLPPVASVTVTPSSGTLAPGAAIQFSAELKDAAGRTLTGRTVTWSSANSALAAVSSTGLASGLAAGSTTITAQSEGRSGSASLSVLAPSSECSTPNSAWIWCDDFEQDRTASYF